MSYGLRIIGSDGGGTFTVSDTELDILNLIVTHAGRAHSFTLPGGLQEGDMVFVKNPSAPGNTAFQSQTIQVPDDYDTRTITFYEPYAYTMQVSGTTVSFFGTDVQGYLPMLDGEYGNVELQKYAGWQAEMDYFVVRKSSVIMSDPNTYRNDLDEGLRVVSSGGEIAFDSRALTTNYTFNIVSYLPPLLTNSIGTQESQYVLTKTVDEYVNIDWTVRNNNSSFFFGLNLWGGSTRASAIDADIGYTGSGDQRLQVYPTGSLFGATLTLGPSGYVPVDGGGDLNDDSDLDPVDVTGSLTYQSGSAITEGQSITFNASTSVEGSYHVRVFQTSGSGDDLTSDRSSFYGNSQTVSFNTLSPTSSRSVQYNRSNNYIGTYSRTRESSYTRGRVDYFSRDFAGNYTGNYEGNFVGNYARTSVLGESFIGDYTGEYSGTYSRTRPSSYTRSRTSSYARDFSAIYSRVRTSAFSDTYSRSFSGQYAREYVGVYAGNFTRDSVANTIQAYTRNSIDQYNEVYQIIRTTGPSTVTYSRTRNSSYVRNREVTREQSFARSFLSEFIGDFIAYYTRSRPSTFSRDRTVTYTAYYTGEFTRNSIGTAVSTYFRMVDFAGEIKPVAYTRGPSTTTFSRTRYSAYARTRGVIRTSSYSRNFVLTYTGNFDGTYSRTRVASFEGNYARDRVTNFEGNYIGDYTRVGSFIGDYTGTYNNPAVDYTRTSTQTRYSSYTRTRTKSSAYSRNFTGTYFPVNSTRVLEFIGNYSRGYARDYTRVVGYTGTYTGYFTGNFAATGTTQNFLGEFISSYTRTSGAYSYTANTTFFRVQDQYTEEGIVPIISVKYQGTTWLLNYQGDYFGSDTIKVQGNDGLWYWRGNSVGVVNGATMYEVAQGTSSSSAFPTGTTTEYTRTSTRTRSENYSDGTTYSRNFTNTFDGTYSRTIPYARDYSRSYLRTSSRTSTYASTINVTYYGVGGDPDVYMTLPHPGYSRTRPSSYSRTLSYDGNYSRTFAGNYTGNYTRSINYEGAYTRTSTRTLYYTRTRLQNFAGNFAGNYARTSVGNFAGNYSRTVATDFVGNYAGNFSRDFTTGFVGNYSRAYAGEYIAYYAGNYTGNYARNFFGNYTANFGGLYARNYAGNYARNFTQSFSRDGGSTYIGNFVVNTYEGNYSRGFVGEYVGNFAGNYIGDFQAAFTGNFTREFSRNRTESYEGNYSRDYSGQYTGNYTGDFNRSFGGNYSRDFAGNYTGEYSGTYNRTSTRSSSFTRDYLRTRVGDYTSVSNRTRVCTYANTFGGNYSRDFVGEYTGNYIGNYSRTSTATQQTSEIGWQGETFVAELRRGGDATSMSEPRGSSNVELLDSKSFTLYDNDMGTVFSTTQNLVHQDATSHTITFDLNTQGDQSISARIYNSSLTTLLTFSLQNANGAQSITVQDVPAEGQSKTYTIGLYNGVEWLVSGEYTVTKVSSTATDSAPAPAPAPSPEPPPTYTGSSFTSENVGLE
jgi:hypothetical protein